MKLDFCRYGFKCRIKAIIFCYEQVFLSFKIMNMGIAYLQVILKWFCEVILD